MSSQDSDLKGGEVVLPSSDAASAPQSAKSEQHCQKGISHHCCASGHTSLQAASLWQDTSVKRAAGAMVKKQTQTL